MMDAFNAKTHAEGRAILRVAEEVRSYLLNAPADDPDVRSLLADCVTLERVGHWLSTSNAATLRQDGIPSAGGSLSATHYWTPDDTKNRCTICGDGPWGRHRFQIQTTDGTLVDAELVREKGSV